MGGSPPRGPPRGARRMRRDADLAANMTEGRDDPIRTDDGTPQKMVQACACSGKKPSAPFQWMQHEARALPAGLASAGSAIRAKGCAIQTGCRGAATGAPLRQKPRNAPEPARSQAEASLKRLPLRLADPHINADTPVANAVTKKSGYENCDSDTGERAD